MSNFKKKLMATGRRSTNVIDLRDDDYPNRIKKGQKASDVGNRWMQVANGIQRRVWDNPRLKDTMQPHYGKAIAEVKKWWGYGDYLLEGGRGPSTRRKKKSK